MAILYYLLLNLSTVYMLKCVIRCSGNTFCFLFVYDDPSGILCEDDCRLVVAKAMWLITVNFLHIVGHCFRIIILMVSFIEVSLPVAVSWLAFSFPFESLPFPFPLVWFEFWV